MIIDLRFVRLVVCCIQGYYDTCDAGMIDEDGFLFIGGRLDDVINVAGHRLSTKEIESVRCAPPLISILDLA